MREMRRRGVKQAGIALAFGRPMSTVAMHVVGATPKHSKLGIVRGMAPSQVPCPSCGKPKKRQARLCRECWNANRVNRLTSGRADRDVCRCGGVKLKVSELCSKCALAAQHSGERFNAVSAVLTPRHPVDAEPVKRPRGRPRKLPATPQYATVAEQARRLPSQFGSAILDCGQQPVAAVACVHHWIIGSPDSARPNYGVCCKCGAGCQFPTEIVADARWKRSREERELEEVLT